MKRFIITVVALVFIGHGIAFGADMKTNRELIEQNTKSIHMLMEIVEQAKDAISNMNANQQQMLSYIERLLDQIEVLQDQIQDLKNR